MPGHRPYSPPTPWIGVIHPVTTLKYKFRCMTYRRGGAIYLQFHRESEAAAGKVFVIPHSRRGYHDLCAAADALLRCSMYDPKVNPASLAYRCIWNDKRPEYVTRAAYVETIALALPRLIDPKAGRPLKLDAAIAREAARRAGGVHVSHVAARTKRRGEVLSLVAYVGPRINEMLERVATPHAMKGYTAEETRTMQQQLQTMAKIVDDMRRYAMTHAYDANPATTGPEHAAAQRAPTGTIVLEDDDEAPAPARYNMTMTAEQQRQFDEDFGPAT